MASPIARRPGGLLDLLLTQQQGRNPSDLLDSVQPILDMAAFYEQERLYVTGGAKTITAVGGNDTILVPAGESWKLIHAGFFVSFATANQIFACTLELINLQIASMRISDLGGTQTPSLANDFRVGIYTPPQPLILPSGAGLKFGVSSLTLDGQANISMTTRVLVVRMET